MNVQNLIRPSKEVGQKLDRAIELVRNRDLAAIRAEFKTEPLDVVGSLLRSVFIAPKGKKLVVCDLSAIENRGLGYVAGDETVLKVFRDGLDPYVWFAVDLYGEPYEVLLKDKEKRQNSKPAVLGCLGAGTLVLTDDGWVPIVNVRPTAKVFDGENFVTTGGVICQGQRHVVNLFGTFSTPDHQFLSSDGRWKRAEHMGGVLPGKPLVPTYDILDAGPLQRYTVSTNLGPMLVHNCGYMLSGGEEKVSDEGDKIFTGLMGYARNMSIPITQELADKSVDVFRNKHKKVVQCWYDLERAAMDCIKTGRPREVGPIRFEKVGTVLKMVLPSGRSLHYVDVAIAEREWFGKTKESIECLGMDQKTHVWGRTYTYGGKLIENCLSGETPVVTDKGVKSLTAVAKTDSVWDGCNWVPHGGIIAKGVQETTNWIGLRGTKNHLILAGNQWRELANMGLSTSLIALLKGRVSTPLPFWSQSQETRAEQPSSAIVDKCVMWLHDRRIEGRFMPVHPAPAKLGNRGGSSEKANQSLTQLFGLCGSTDGLESFLGVIIQSLKHIQIMEDGVLLSTSPGWTASLNGCGLLSPSLDGTSLDWILTELTTMKITSQETSNSLPAKQIQTTAAKQPRLPLGGRPSRIVNSGSSTPRNGVEEPFDTIWRTGEPQSGASAGMTRREEVFDLLNSGPNHRFTVLTSLGPVIVHNCVQAISRDVLTNGLLLAEQLGFRTVMHTHDELVCEVDERSPLGIKQLREAMISLPSWGNDQLLLDAAGFEGLVYRKD